MCTRTGCAEQSAAQHQRTRCPTDIVTSNTQAAQPHNAFACGSATSPPNTAHTPIGRCNLLQMLHANYDKPQCQMHRRTPGCRRSPPLKASSWTTNESQICQRQQRDVSLRVSLVAPLITSYRLMRCTYTGASIYWHCLLCKARPLNIVLQCRNNLKYLNPGGGRARA